MVIGVQTYTVRKIFQTEAEIDSTLKKLSTMGIKYLELAYYPFDSKSIEILCKYLDKYSMKVISCQIKYKIIINEFDEIMEIMKTLNCKYLAISVIPFRRLIMGFRGLKKLAGEFNKLGERVSSLGIQLLFHHHNYEFIKFRNELAFDILLKHLNPIKVKILSDTYWIKKGGFSCIDFFEKYADFIKALHLRGYINKADTNLSDNEIDFLEVIDYARKNDFYYAVIEQNTDSPLKELEKSIKIVKEFGFDKLFNVEER